MCVCVYEHVVYVNVQELMLCMNAHEGVCLSVECDFILLLMHAHHYVATHMTYSVRGVLCARSEHLVRGAEYT